MIRAMDGHQKDTLINIESTGAFVINIVSGDLAGKMNATSVEAPANVNEFEFAGLTPEPSREVKPPRVAESPIHLECKLNQIIEISREPGGGSVVIGTVVHIHVEEKVLVGEDKINLSALNPIGRLAGYFYVRVTDVFEMERPPSKIRGKSM
jgi:flavin reductase (DIM6/NTAB) family NADH-FMN oxidoreductase RutF